MTTRHPEPVGGSPLGFVPGRPNPVQLHLQARGIDLQRLAAEVYASP